MRPYGLALAAAFSLLLPGAALASPSTSMMWDGCIGPVQKTVTPGSTADLYVSVLGQTQAAQSYQISVLLQSPAGLPDAWRFDPAGCQYSLLTIDHKPTAAIAKTCPAFQGNLQSLQIKDFSYDPIGGRGKIVLANAYPNGGAGNPAATDPNQRYFLMHVAFNELYGVDGAGDPPNTCGGLERPVCFYIFSNSWLDTAGNEIPWAIATQSVLANDPTNASHCPGFVPVPAASATWGRIKSQYRR